MRRGESRDYHVHKRRKRMGREVVDLVEVVEGEASPVRVVKKRT
jgi:hypothetical protein